MGDDNDENAEIVRLRDLGAWMRDVGATELELGDVRIKLAPRPPAAPGRALSAPERDEARALADESREADKVTDEEAAHYNFWRRLTRSSGAPIPAFRPRDKASS